MKFLCFSISGGEDSATAATGAQKQSMPARYLNLLQMQMDVQLTLASIDDLFGSFCCFTLIRIAFHELIFSYGIVKNTLHLVISLVLLFLQA
jgi:hypothetical protein